MPKTHNDNTVQLTQTGLDELKAELEELKKVKLPHVVDRVAQARSHGDLSENAEYTAAKEEQQFIETRISEIEDVLERSQVVSQTRSTTKVGMGSRVTIESKKTGKETTYTIVGEFEANPTEKKISSVSPLGKALKGKKKGDEVEVVAPGGSSRYVIRSIK